MGEFAEEMLVLDHALKQSPISIVLESPGGACPKAASPVISRKKLNKSLLNGLLAIVG
jgi:hypothetical protein